PRDPPDPAAESSPDLRCPPVGVVPLQPDDLRFQRQRELVRVAVRTTAPVGETVDAIVLIPLVNLVARLARDSELSADRGHLLAIQQAGDEPETLVHDV